MASFRRTPLLLQVAFAHLHEWLPGPGLDGDAFVTTLQKANIQRVAFLRHGKTAPAENGVDFDRQLTDLGRTQAQEAGGSFGKKLTPFFPTLLVSPAPRTVETAKLFCDAAGENELQFYNDSSVLYDGTMQPKGSQLFQKIGYAPLQEYLDNPDMDDRHAARTVLGTYAHSVAQVMMEAVASAEESNKSGTTLWMVGHAIYLPAAALGVASLMKCNQQGQDLILTTNTIEAEGYLLDIDSGDVSYLSRPSNNHSDYCSSS